MLNYRAIDVTAESLRGKIYIPGKEGTLTTEMIARTRQYGLLPYVLSPQPAAILSEVSAGNPVLVLQNLSFNWLPRWHFSIVTGFDLKEELLILRSGNEKALETPFSLFMKTWERADRWAIVINSPDQLPVTVEETKYVLAALELELVGKTGAAHKAYETATAKWPENETAWFGAGNTAYQLGDYARATRFYKAYLEQNPDSASGWNNLAHSLMQLRCREDSLLAISCALAIEPGNAEFLDSEERLRTPPGPPPEGTASSNCPGVECPHFSPM